MAGNSNYRKGVRWERDRIKFYKEVLKADAVVRASGSHSPFDIVVFRKGRVTAIQCKVTADPAAAKRLLSGFKANPPLGNLVSNTFDQTLEVKITGSTEVHSVTV